MLAKEGEDHARALGIAPRTLQASSQEARRHCRKGGLKEGWIWRLSAEEGQRGPKSAKPKEWHSSGVAGTLRRHAPQKTDPSDSREGKDVLPDFSPDPPGAALADDGIEMPPLRPPPYCDPPAHRNGKDKRPPCAQCNSDDGQQTQRGSPAGRSGCTTSAWNSGFRTRGVAVARGASTFRQRDVTRAAIAVAAVRMFGLMESGR